MNNKLTTEEFTSRSTILHNNKYDYSLVEYINSYTKVKIICPVHGVFEQRPSDHMRNIGCSKCSGKSPLTTIEFINRSTAIHGNRYDYSLTEYYRSKSKVKIVCPLHGIFEQTPNDHLYGKGCNGCAGAKRYNTTEFINKANIIHNFKYDYSLSNYINSTVKIKIICKEHGLFDQLPSSHIFGNGCNYCATINRATKCKDTINEFINKANFVHNNKYDYSLVEYDNSKSKVIIICPEHGIFEQKPNGHINGQGCPRCINIISSQECEICNQIDEHNIQYIKSDRIILVGKELDIYIPSHNIAIEFNGIYWHSEGNGKSRQYHLNKTKECYDKNIQLLHIFENEWLDNNKKEIWKSIIDNKLGICSQKIFARKCQINGVDNKTVKQFLLTNHLQGHVNSTINIGLYYENELVSLMTFGKSRYNKNYQYELIRFCNKINTVIIGGASKIFKYFIRNYNPESLISYADLRYSNGTLYEKLGFTKLKNSTPNYFYFKINNTLKLMSRVQFQKHKLQNKLGTFNQELTEYQNMLNNGYDRIWDCGNGVYEYNK